MEEPSINSIIRQASRSVVEALAILHYRSICHAGILYWHTLPLLPSLINRLDLRPANVALGLQCLDGSEEEQVLSQLGEPDKETIQIREDSLLTPDIPYPPKHIVYPVEFDDAGWLTAYPPTGSDDRLWTGC
jgi:hypothetical protein